ncbi:TlpA family protein disulfide reductase [Mangrovibacterium diazotrophicum]|uniref:Peroxiredoxin n=1 Tax=Mangrovibacterium diazotrophicum TaxID=1261403 RepID=A0A419W6R8_9BACT|nr:TlpA disulfide reductase family protein [Mangrovibacterium diazotrophicum]RKD91149.1 peroxiredoxin [Mangrovibacterium diazotrophicum]
MKLKLTLFLISLSLIAFAQKSHIEGTIDGIDNATIHILALPLKEGAKPIFDTTSCTDGKFNYTLNYGVNMWHLVIISSDSFNAFFGSEKSSKQELQNRDIRFFIKPVEDIVVSASFADYGIKCSITGNDIGRQMNQVKEAKFPYSERFNQLTIQKEKEPEGSNKIAELDKELQSVNDQLDSIDLQIIAKHSDWEYSADLLAKFPNDTIEKYYNRFTPTVKNSIFGAHVSNALTASKKDLPAPSFSLPDTTGKIHSLSDYKGKYVVLDFWGTWCGSCVGGFPKLKEYYSKYKDRVEFIGIDCQDHEELWKNAVVKYELNWTNLFAANKVITENYGITNYPTKFIIDREGNIVLKSSGEDQEFYDMLDELFN